MCGVRVNIILWFEPANLCFRHVLSCHRQVAKGLGGSEQPVVISLSVASVVTATFVTEDFVAKAVTLELFNIVLKMVSVIVIVANDLPV